MSLGMKHAGGQVRFAWLALAAVAVLVSAQGSAAEPKHTGLKPNVVVVLADDLGYGDLGCYGNDVIETPHLDRFARQGLRLTNCYSAAPNCSPARAGLMTGRTPYRAGIYNWIPMFSPMHLRSSDTTVATLLRDAGYATCHVGKWHLNGRFNLPGQPQPGDHGFEHWFSTQNNALPNHHDPFNFVRKGEPVGKLEGYSAELVVDEAVRWLEHKRDRSKPFFLFVCFHEPHEPIATAARYCERYAKLGDPARAAHHGNITQMDAAFGRLMQALDEQALGDETLVFFTSDNGPAITAMHPYGSAGPLRSKKGYLYEGGIRVPGLLRWPGHTTPGAISDEPASGVDLLPTLCDITGIEPPRGRAIDGASLLPILDGRRVVRATPLYWQFNYPASGPHVAIREGDWKLVAYLSGEQPRPTANITAEAMEAIQTAQPERFELYNLRRDVGETTDVALQEPRRVEEMAARLRELYREIQDENPVWPPWESPRYEGELIRYETDARRQARER